MFNDVLLSSETIAIVLFLVGVVLVVESVETFVESIAESAAALGVSGFLLTVLLAGIDLENAVLGIAAMVGDLPYVAIGTVFGEALFILGAAVGLAGFVAPFETRMPLPYLLLFFGSPVVFLALSIDGTLSRIDGMILLLSFLPLLAAVYRLERDRETSYLPTEELGAVMDEDFGDESVTTSSGCGNAEQDDNGRRRGLYRLGVAILAVIGMTIGSELAVEGARGLLEALGIAGLAFGATVLSFVASLEELFLTITPVRQGREHLGVGNVIGSMLFFVTANAGVIALIRPIDVGGAVTTVHWPFLVGGMALVGGMFYRGRVKRPEGALLVALYVAYWVANYY